MNSIEIDDVSKTFGTVTAVDNLSLTVPRGSVYGFIGPNGSGKTTTIRMIMRIYHPDHGRIRIFGEEQSTAATDRIGYLPEERGLYLARIALAGFDAVGDQYDVVVLLHYFRERAFAFPWSSTSRISCSCRPAASASSRSP